MDYLHDQIKALAIDFLVKKNRGYGGRLDLDKQAQALTHMLQAKEISEIFSFSNKDQSSEAIEYKQRLNSLISNVDERHISWETWHRNRVFSDVIKGVLERITKEAEASASAAESWHSKQKILDLEAQLEFGKPANAVTFWDKLNTQLNLPYLILFCLSIILISGLTIIGLNADMTVNVEFNIGEILGALLIGTGVAAAGVSYATRGHTTGEESES